MKKNELEKLVNEYLPSAQGLGKKIRSWEIPVSEAKRLERLIFQHFMGRVKEKNLSRKEAEELWKNIILEIGINDPSFSGND